MKILIIDTNNIFWISRGLQTQESADKKSWPINSQFFTIINSYLRIHEPDSVIFLGEGNPGWRYSRLKSYKESRIERRANDTLNEDFSRQKRDTRNMLKAMPFYYFKHDNLEADDIAYLVCKFLNNKNINCEIICISTDADWQQNMLYFENVSIWNPLKKVFKEKPSNNFIELKAICGDTSDEIPKIKRGFGKKSAEKVLSDEKTFNEWFNSLTKEQQEQYLINLFVIDFKNIPLDYENDVFNIIENYNFPKLEWEFFKLYCKERKMFRFLKNIDNKKSFYLKLKPFIEHKYDRSKQF